MDPGDDSLEGHQPPESSECPAEHRGIWHRIVGVPARQVLAAGMTPEKIALSIALGVVFGLFPIVGVTTLLCFLAGLWFRLNQPAIQLVNLIVYPVQIALVVAFVRLGEGIVGARPVALSGLAGQWRHDPVLAIGRFGLSGLHGILGWGVVAPFVGLAFYLTVLPILRRLASRRAASRPEASRG